MLTITIPSMEIYDPVQNVFSVTKECTMNLEHSLLSLSKWEAKWHKPFFSSDNKTNEECLDYIKCMTINNVDDDVYNRLTEKNVKEIQEYIEDPMTATIIIDRRPKTKKEIVTSELIYYWMISLQIPMECQKWHLSRLLTLIKVCDINNDPKGGKMSKRESMEYMKELNKRRRESMHTNG